MPNPTQLGITRPEKGLSSLLYGNQLATSQTPNVSDAAAAMSSSLRYQNMLSSGNMYTPKPYETSFSQELKDCMGKYLQTLELWTFKTYPLHSEEIFKRLRSSTLRVVSGFAKQGKQEEITQRLIEKEQALMKEFLTIDRDVLFL